MTFGRPIMTTHAQNIPLPSLVEDTDGTSTSSDLETPMRISYFIHSVLLSEVLEQILDRIYQSWRSRSGDDDAHADRNRGRNFNTITELDSQLAEFEITVPEFLSWTKTPTRDKS